MHDTRELHQSEPDQWWRETFGGSLFIRPYLGGELLKTWSSDYIDNDEPLFFGCGVILTDQ